MYQLTSARRRVIAAHVGTVATLRAYLAALVAALAGGAR